MLGEIHWSVMQKVINDKSAIMMKSSIEYIKNKIMYDWVSPPMKTILVSTEDVDYYGPQKSFSNTFGQVAGGEWDLPDNLNSIMEHWIVIGLKDRFVEGLAWEDTEYVTHASRTFFDKNKPIKGCDSREEFINKDVHMWIPYSKVWPRTGI